MRSKKQIKLEQKIVAYTQDLSYVIATLPTKMIDFKKIVKQLKEFSSKVSHR